MTRPTTRGMSTWSVPEIPGVVEYVYDGAGHVTDEIFKANGAEAWRTSYGYGGDRVHVTPPDGGTATTTISDARGRTVALRQYHGATPTGAYDEVSYSYTQRGELASMTDAAGNMWSYEYDQRGRQVTADDPDSGLATMTYDAVGQLETSTDARGITLGFTYDDLGRQISVRDDSPTGPVRAEWVYDTLPGGLGKLTRSIRHQDGAEYVTGVLGYDDAGRPTGGRVTVPASETGLAGSYDTTLTYRPDGSVGSMTYAAAGDISDEQVIYLYNDVGQQTGMGSGKSIYVYDAVYNELGELVQRTLGNYGKRTAITHTYDEPTGRLTGISATPELRPQVLDLAYEYDDAGNVVRIADSPGSATPNDTQCFRYDYARRLTDAWTPALTGEDNCDTYPAALGGQAPYRLVWTYDEAGNRLTQDRYGPDAGASTYTYPGAGQPQPHALLQVSTSGPAGSQTDTFAYDDAGNTIERVVDGVTQDLTWDAEGRSAEIEDPDGSTEFVYDADGNRLVRRDPDGAKVLYLDGQELRYEPGAGTTCTRYYSHLGTQVAVRTADGVTWLVTDHQNTATVEVRDSDMQVQRRRSLPFGGDRGADPGWWAGDKGFLGGTEDPTGLTHLGARLYDPGIGRFISVDPLLKLVDPQHFNGYAYAEHNPATWSDPSGLMVPPIEGAPAKTKNTPTDVIRETYNSAGDVYQENLVTGEAWINGVTIPEYLVVDPYALLEEMADPNNRAYSDDGSRGPNSADELVFWTLWALQDACSANKELNCDEGAVQRAWEVIDAWLQIDTPPVRDYLGAPAEMWEQAIEGGWGQDPGGMLDTGMLPGSGPKGPGKVKAPKPKKGCNSFPPGTFVLMADDTTKPIEDIEVGDLVLATDADTGITEANPVTDTITSVGEKSLVQLTITTIDPSATTVGPLIVDSSLWSATVVATDNHPFWTTDQGTWTNAADLQSGDQLHTPNHTTVTITATRTYTHVLTVHNLTVASSHTYYVAAGAVAVAILVHNESCEWPSQQPGRGGCEQCAAEIQGQIGGDLRTIRPRGGAPSLGASQYDPHGNWQYHTVVVKDGRVYDAFTGSGGMTFGQYKAQFQYADYIDFGF